LDTKIRILEAIRQGQIGGGESHVFELTENIDRSKFELVVLSFTDGPLVKKIRNLGIKCFVIQTEKPFDWKVWSQVSKLIKSEKINIVHAHGTRALSNVFRSSKMNNIPIIYTIHGWSFHDDQKFLRKSISILIEKYLTRIVNKNISVSYMNRETGKKHLGKFHSEVIQNGVNLSKFNPLRQYKDIRKEFGISQKDTLVGYLARITKQKDPDSLVKAFAEISTQNDKIKLIIIGEGDLKHRMMELVDQYGLKDNVYTDDFRDDIPDILKAVDIYCLPSLWEGLSIGLLEAMAMKNAIIATNVDGTKEVIQEGVNGLLFDPGNYKALAENIIRLHEDIKERQKLQENAFQTVKLNFSIDGMVNKVESIYEDLALINLR